MGHPSELMYAADLVRMAPTMEQQLAGGNVYMFLLPLHYVLLNVMYNSTSNYK